MPRNPRKSGNKEGIQKQTKDHPALDRIELGQSLDRAGASSRVRSRAVGALEAAQAKHGVNKPLSRKSPVGRMDAAARRRK